MKSRKAHLTVAEDYRLQGLGPVLFQVDEYFCKGFWKGLDAKGYMYLFVIQINTMENIMNVVPAKDQADRSVSFRTKVNKVSRIDAVAESLGLSRSKVINDALDDYLQYHEWLAAEIQKGRDDFEAGRIARPEDVQAVFDKYRRS